MTVRQRGVWLSLMAAASNELNCSRL